MRAVGISHPGCVRVENQDCFRFQVPATQDTLTAVLCDGMGGAQAGLVASTMAADAFMSHAANSIDVTSTASDMRLILTEAVNYANVKVYDKSFLDFTCMGMGSTLVAILMTPKRIFLANVGDSRCYLIQGGKIQQMSQDHSYVAELVRKGQLTREQARNHPHKNMITRAVGVEASLHADISEIKAGPGAKLLLCSDGLSNMVTDEEILMYVLESDSSESAARSMMALTLQRGAPDNVTVLIAER